MKSLFWTLFKRHINSQVRLYSQVTLTVSGRPKIKVLFATKCLVEEFRSVTNKVLKFRALQNSGAESSFKTGFAAIVSLDLVHRMQVNALSNTPMNDPRDMVSLEVRSSPSVTLVPMNAIMVLRITDRTPHVFLNPMELPISEFKAR